MSTISKLENLQNSKLRIIGLMYIASTHDEKGLVPIERAVELIEDLASDVYLLLAEEKTGEQIAIETLERRNKEEED